MSASDVPKRENVSHSIPDSTITLEIVLNEARLLNSSDIDACISGAITEAKKPAHSSLVEGVFNYTSPTPAQLGFAITGGMFANEFTWSDVVTSLQGLQSFYAERKEYVKVLMYLEDQRRGALGQASVKTAETLALAEKTVPNHGVSGDSD